MPLTNVFRTSPQLGPGLTLVDADPWYDPFNITSPSYQLGQVHQGSNGHDYIWVLASANIAAAAAPGTAVTITEPAFTAAAGAGGWNAPIEGVTSGEYFHARRTVL